MSNIIRRAAAFLRSGSETPVADGETISVGGKKYRVVSAAPDADGNIEVTYKASPDDLGLTVRPAAVLVEMTEEEAAFMQRLTDLIPKLMPAEDIPTPAPQPKPTPTPTPTDVGSKAKAAAPPKPAPERPDFRKPPTQQNTGVFNNWHQELFNNPDKKKMYFNRWRLFIINLIVLVILAASTMIALHGWPFFVFRSNGTGSTNVGPTENQGPGQPDAPKPKPSPSHIPPKHVKSKTVVVHPKAK